MPEKPNASFTIASVIAVVAAVASFFQGATFGLLLALVAMAFGLIGLVLSLSAKKRGGVASAAAILFGLLGIVAAVIKAMLHLFG